MTRSAKSGILQRITLLTAVVLAHGSSGAAEPGSWQALGPFGGEIKQIAIHEADPNVVYAGTDAGLFRSKDGGRTWKAVAGGLPESLFVAILDISSTEPVVYAGDNGSLFKSTNGELGWKALPLPLQPFEYLVDLSLRPGTTNELAAATESGIFVSTDGGDSWQSRTPNIPNAYYQNVYFQPNGNLLVGKYADGSGDLESAALLKSTDGGLSWTAIHPELSTGPNPPPPLLATTHILGSKQDPQGLFVAAGSIVLASADGGTQWKLVTLPQTASGCGYPWTIAAAPSSAMGLFVGCAFDGLHYSDDVLALSTAWTNWGVADGLNELDVRAVSPHPDFPSVPVIRVGTVNGAFATDDGGSSWADANQGLGHVATRTIEPHPVDTDPQESTIMAGGDFGPPLFKSDDGGAHWSIHPDGLAAYSIRTILIDPTTVDTNPLTAEPFTAYAAGHSQLFPPSEQNGGIYKTSDGGESWTTIDNGIAIVNGVPSMGQIRALVADPRSCSLPPCIPGSSPLQTLYVAGNGRGGAPGMPYRSARIYKSTNGGQLWTPSDAGLPLVTELGPPELEETSDVFVIPMVIDPLNPSTLYVGTAVGWNYELGGGIFPSIDNGVFKSTDGGANWFHSSNGLPRCEGPTSSHCDVLALAINPVNPNELYASLLNYNAVQDKASIYKSVDGGANWTLSKDALPGSSARALAYETDGSIIYAGLSGRSDNPGGVLRSIDGGLHWNSMSVGLSISSVLAIETRPRPAGSAGRLLIGTESGVWDYSVAADGDADGAPDAVENDNAGGDGNDDSIPDSIQSDVATLARTVASSGTSTDSTGPLSGVVTISIVPSPDGCSQLNDATVVEADQLPGDPGNGNASSASLGLVRFALPECEFATVRVRYHGADFSGDHVWRNYGPRTPGDPASEAWYTFAGASLIDGETWELIIDAGAQGNIRPDPRNILFMGGPASDRIFAHGFE